MADDATITLDAAEIRWSWDDPDPASVLSTTPEGRYEDLGVLGRGAMGEVRRVRDRWLNRVPAMKVIPLDASDDRLSRFIAEAQATAQLEHPGIVPVHEIGRLGDGRLSSP